VNWRNNPKIMAAREIAQQFGKDRVILVMLTADTLETASYGADGRLCTQAGKLANLAFDAIAHELGFDEVWK